MNVVITGDLYLTRSNINSINKNGIEKSFARDLLSLIQRADFAITNYESAIKGFSSTTNAKGINKIGPILSSHPDAMKIVKEMGFNCVTLANNHIRDLGSKGIIDTLVTAHRNGLETIGAEKTREEAQRPLYIEVNGISIAIINFCENEFSTLARQGNPQANAYNPIEIFYQVQEAKSNADFVLLIVHAGHEGYALPSPRMKRDFRFFVDAGAGAVICHHAHCHTGYEVYHNAPIFYGLGNFVFEGDSTEASVWNYGYALELTLTNVGNEIAHCFTLHPYKQGLKGDTILLHSLNKEERVRFEYDIYEKNQVIANDNALREAFNRFAKANKLKDYILSPYVGRIAQALNARGLLPSFISRRKKMLLTNVLRCEAHRDCVTTNLEEDYI